MAARLARKPLISHSDTLALEESDKALLISAIQRVTCSERWTDDLFELIEARKLHYCDNQEAGEQVGVLYNRAAYPPGGKRTRMRKCASCRKWLPPQVVGSSRTIETKDGFVRVDECYECYLNGLTLFEISLLPSSPKFIDSDQAIAEGLKFIKKRKRGPRHKDPARSRIPDRPERRRYIGDDGIIREEVMTEGGFFELVLILQEPEPPSPRQPDHPENEAA